MIGFTNCEVVNTISIFKSSGSALALSIFHFLVSFFLHIIGNSSIMLHDVGLLDADV